jgi:hypothetical protein
LYQNVLKNTPIKTAAPIIADIIALPEAGSMYAKALLHVKKNVEKK